MKTGCSRALSGVAIRCGHRLPNEYDKQPDAGHKNKATPPPRLLYYDQFKSGRLDLNQRPSASEADALPGCATSRKNLWRRSWSVCCSCKSHSVKYSQQFGVVKLMLRSDKRRRRRPPSLSGNRRIQLTFDVPRRQRLPVANLVNQRL